ncbi:hypothetical protein B0H17DRAFT_949637, partial [Mycena rosella]
PSSLRIHANTHTGARRGVQMPAPGCGRAFNVNSNMRRHFRNHKTTTFAPPPALPSASFPRSYRALSCCRLPSLPLRGVTVGIRVPVRCWIRIWRPTRTADVGCAGRVQRR